MAGAERDHAARRAAARQADDRPGAARRAARGVGAVLDGHRVAGVHDVGGMLDGAERLKLGSWIAVAAGRGNEQLPARLSVDAVRPHEHGKHRRQRYPGAMRSTHG